MEMFADFFLFFEQKNNVETKKQGNQRLP
jgi:hypothetical protein